MSGLASNRKGRIQLGPRGGRSLRSCWLLCFALTVFAAQAESGGSGSTGTEPRETIGITGSRTRYVPVEGPVVAFEVDELEIDRAVPLVLTDALRGIGSIHMQSTTAGQGSPFLRGLTGSGVLSLVDGMRLNNAIYRSAPNPYLDLVDAHLVQRIDVIRGPASVRHGSDAMGGVIAVATRSPTFDGDEWSARGRVAGLFSSADLARGVRAEIETGRSGLGFRGGFTGLSTSDLRGGGDTGTQQPTDFQSIGGDAALLWLPDDRQRVHADLQFLKQPNTPRYSELVAGFHQQEPSSLVFQYQPLERLFGHLGYEIDDPSRGIDTLSLDLSYQRIRDDRLTRDYATSERQYAYREHNASELMGVVLAGRSRLADWIEMHWGADAYLDWVTSTRTQVDVASGTPVPWLPRFPDGSTMNSYGVHSDFVLELGSQVQANAGIRFSYIETRIATRLSDVHEVNNDDVTGAIGLVWSPRPELRVIASFRRGFRAPNVFDLGTLGPRPGNRYNIPTTELSPEVIYTYDLGVAYSGDRFEGEIFGFYSSYDDKIASVLTHETTPDLRDIVQSANEKLMRLAGVEASAQLRLAGSLSLMAEAFYTWGEQEVRGGSPEPADRIPPFQGRVGLAYQLREGIWIEPYMRFAARQDRLSDRDLQDPRINPAGTPGWITLGVRSQWTWNEHVDLILELRNLTDADYREHGSGYQAAGAGVATSVQITF